MKKKQKAPLFPKIKERKGKPPSLVNKKNVQDEHFQNKHFSNVKNSVILKFKVRNGTKDPIQHLS